MKYTAVIFDMDGTIINSDTVWHRATHELLAARSVTVTPELKQFFSIHLHGVDIRASCSLIKQHMNFPDAVEDLVREKIAVANRLYKDEISFVDGFTTFHEKLLTHRCAIGLATNANRSTVQAADAKLNLTQLFGDHMYTIDHVHGIGKPDPRIFLYTAEKLGAAPERCIVFEDSAHGVMAAKKAGMFCVGITTAKRPELLSQADAIINHYDELDIKKLLHILT